MSEYRLVSLSISYDRFNFLQVLVSVFEGASPVEVDKAKLERTATLCYMEGKWVLPIHE